MTAADTGIASVRGAKTLRHVKPRGDCRGTVDRMESAVTLHRYLLLASALIVPGLAQAANPGPPPPLAAEHRLSEAEIAKVLETAAEKREAVD